MGNAEGIVTPVPGLLVGTPAFGHGFATVTEALQEVPVVALTGGVVDPAEFVTEPGCVPAVLDPVVAPAASHGPGPVFVVAPELVSHPELPGLGVG